MNLPPAPVYNSYYKQWIPSKQWKPVTIKIKDNVYPEREHSVTFTTKKTAEYWIECLKPLQGKYYFQEGYLDPLLEAGFDLSSLAPVDSDVSTEPLEDCDGDFLLCNETL